MKYLFIIILVFCSANSWGELRDYTLNCIPWKDDSNLKEFRIEIKKSKLFFNMIEMDIVGDPQQDIKKDDQQDIYAVAKMKKDKVTWIVDFNKDFLQGNFTRKYQDQWMEEEKSFVTGFSCKIIN